MRILYLFIFFNRGSNNKIMIIHMYKTSEGLADVKNVDDGCPSIHFVVEL